MLKQSDLKQEQEECIDALYESNRLLIAEKGLGKTVIGQTAVQALLNDDVIHRCLIVAPKRVVELGWAQEWLKWEHLIEPGIALGDEGERLWIVNDDWPIVVTSNDHLKWFVESGEIKAFDALLIDEISRYKAPGSKGVKLLRRVRKQFEWIGAMSASPLAESATGIYSQALIVDGGKSLGTRYDRFLQNFFYPTDYMQRRWSFQPSGEARLAEALKEVIFMADDTNYEAGLPELRDEVINIEMGPEAWTAYTDMCNDMFIDGPDIEAANQAVVSGKLLQICAGSVYDNDGNVIEYHHAKYDALHALIGQADGPVAVAYSYQHQLEELRLMYPDIAVLADDAVRIEAEWNAGNIALMALHPKSAGMGLNLQGGHELIILSPIWSADQNSQLLGRFRRRGQRSKYVRRTTLVVPGSVDELVIDRQLNKQAAESSLTEHIRAVAQT